MGSVNCLAASNNQPALHILEKKNTQKKKWSHSFSQLFDWWNTVGRGTICTRDKRGADCFSASFSFFFFADGIGEGVGQGGKSAHIVG